MSTLSREQVDRLSVLLKQGKWSLGDNDEAWAIFEQFPAHDLAQRALLRQREEQFKAMTYRLDVAEPELTACRARADYAEQQLATMTAERDAARNSEVHWFQVATDDGAALAECRQQLAAVTAERDDLLDNLSLCKGNELAEQLAASQARCAELEPLLEKHSNLRTHWRAAYHEEVKRWQAQQDAKPLKRFHYQRGADGVTGKTVWDECYLAEDVDALLRERDEEIANLKTTLAASRARCAELEGALKEVQDDIVKTNWPNLTKINDVLGTLSPERPPA